MDFANSFTGTFPVTVIHDNIYEYPDETFNIQILSVTYSGVNLNNIGTVDSTVVTIGDDGDAGTLSFEATELNSSMPASPSSTIVMVVRGGATIKSLDKTFDVAPYQ